MELSGPETAMKIVKGWIETNKFGSRCDFEFEVEDDTPPEDIEEMARDAAFENMDWSYEVDG